MLRPIEAEHARNEAEPRPRAAAPDLTLPTPGRCIYCDDRCAADAYLHDYCREDCEREQAERQAALPR